MSFIYHEDETIEEIYERNLEDAPIGAGGFVKDICWERAVEEWANSVKEEERKQGFV